MQVDFIIGDVKLDLDTFDDNEELTKAGGLNKINAIKVFYTDQYVRGFEIFYQLNTGDMMITEHNVPKKRKDSLQNTIFEIGPDDYISEIAASFENGKKSKIINITFLTYRGKAQTFGGEGPQSFKYDEPGFTFGAFAGGFKKQIEWLAIEVLPLPEQFNPKEEKLEVLQADPLVNIPELQMETQNIQDTNKIIQFQKPERGQTQNLQTTNKIIAKQIQFQKSLNNQTNETKEIKQNKIVKIKEEIDRISLNLELTEQQFSYLKSILQDKLLDELMKIDVAKQPEKPTQNISQTDPQTLLYVLKEQLQEQNRNLVITEEEEYSSGLDALVQAHGQDQQYLKLTLQLDYNEIENDDQQREKFLSEYRKKIANQLNVFEDEVVILGIEKGSCILSFTISSKYDIISDSDAIQCLSQICNGRIEIYNYLVGAQNQGLKNFCLSPKDFSPEFNQNWANFHESEERGPPGYRYTYYFPRSCQGFGLNIEKFGNNKDWIAMDGRPGEWRILYHGTWQEHLSSIVQTNLKPGRHQAYQSSVGKGIYFSDKIEVCRGYTQETTVGDKKFRLYFMSRCRPEAVKQDEFMEKIHYFVVNKSKDVRPYRILLEEC